MSKERQYHQGYTKSKSKSTDLIGAITSWRDFFESQSCQRALIQPGQGQLWTYVYKMTETLTQIKDKFKNSIDEIETKMLKRNSANKYLFAASGIAKVYHLYAQLFSNIALTMLSQPFICNFLIRQAQTEVFKITNLLSYIISHAPDGYKQVKKLVSQKGQGISVNMIQSCLSFNSLSKLLKNAKFIEESNNAMDEFKRSHHSLSQFISVSSSQIMNIKKVTLKYLNTFVEQISSVKKMCQYLDQVQQFGDDTIEASCREFQGQFEYKINFKDEHKSHHCKQDVVVIVNVINRILLWEASQGVIRSRKFERYVRRFLKNKHIKEILTVSGYQVYKSKLKKRQYLQIRFVQEMMLSNHIKNKFVAMLNGVRAYYANKTESDYLLSVQTLGQLLSEGYKAMSPYLSTVQKEIKNTNMNKKTSTKVLNRMVYLNKLSNVVRYELESLLDWTQDYDASDYMMVLYGLRASTIALANQKECVPDSRLLEIIDQCLRTPLLTNMVDSGQQDLNIAQAKDYHIKIIKCAVVQKMTKLFDAKKAMHARFYDNDTTMKKKLLGIEKNIQAALGEIEDLESKQNCIEDIIRILNSIQRVLALPKFNLLLHYQQYNFKHIPRRKILMVKAGLSASQKVDPMIESLKKILDILSGIKLSMVHTIHSPYSVQLLAA